MTYPPNPLPYEGRGSIPPLLAGEGTGVRFKREGEALAEPVSDRQAGGQYPPRPARTIRLSPLAGRECRQGR